MDVFLRFTQTPADLICLVLIQRGLIYAEEGGMICQWAIVIISVVNNGVECFMIVVRQVCDCLHPPVSVVHLMVLQTETTVSGITECQNHSDLNIFLA